MKRNTIMLLAMLLAFAQGAWAQTGSWSDYKAESFSTTGTNSITIKSEAELALLAYNVNNGTTYAGYTITLDKGLDLSAHYWVPIGMEDGKEQNQTIQNKAFKGTFDGNGNTISGINVNMSEGWGVGLFGYISKATIKNVTITSSSFVANGFVGAISGSSAGVDQYNPATIENCHVANSVTVEAKDFGAGGIIGIDNDNLIIKDCTCAATIKSSDPNSRAGGIIGVAYEDSYYMATIIDSYYLGNMSAIGENGGTQYHATINITLLDNDSEATVKNATRISNYNGQKANVTLSGRTLWKDGDWNTLCLPFEVKVGSGQMSGATAMTLITSSSGFNTSTGVLTLNFDNVASGNTINAGTPFIVKWTGTHVSDPVFIDVTVNSTEAGSVTSTDGYVTFCGNYGLVNLAANDRTKLYLGAANKLYWPSDVRPIGAFRAYFQLNGIVAGDKTNDPKVQSVRAFNLSFGDETTGILSPAEIAEIAEMAGAWYSLDGRTLDAKPTKKGLYIHNGRKIVIK